MPIGNRLFSNGEFELPMIPYGDNSFIVHGTLIAKQLGYHEAKDMARVLGEDEKTLVRGVGKIADPSDQGVWYLTEPGFYRVVGQRNVNVIKNPEVKAAVHRFQRWVFHEVLPAMLRSGQASEARVSGTTWSWVDVSFEVRQRYGLDYKPTEITRGLRAAGWLRNDGAVPKHEHRAKFWHTGTAYHLLPHALPELVTTLVSTLRDIGDPQASQYQLAIFPARGVTA
ncbi:MAG: BRO family protein [Gordonia sp. (in: high G+C Gram-positive bacteria)]